MKLKARVTIQYRNEIGDGIGEIGQHAGRIARESDFSQVVLEGVNEMARSLRREAPIGRAGSIPPSIKSGRVTKKGDTYTGITWTNLKQAVFTNEGTGTHRAGGSPYNIEKTTLKGRKYTIQHPGIKAQHWWERGANLASPLALRSFKKKVDRIMR